MPFTMRQFQDWVSRKLCSTLNDIVTGIFWTFRHAEMETDKSYLPIWNVFLSPETLLFAPIKLFNLQAT